MLITAERKTVHTTPNARMTTHAAPSLGTNELAVWQVDMHAGQEGPDHTMDGEQVWTVLAGELHVTIGVEQVVAAVGDSVALPAGAQRRIAAPQGLRAIVAARAGTTVSAADRAAQPLPWAQ